MHQYPPIWLRNWNLKCAWQEIFPSQLIFEFDNDDSYLQIWIPFLYLNVLKNGCGLRNKYTSYVAYKTDCQRTLEIAIRCDIETLEKSRSLRYFFSNYIYENGCLCDMEKLKGDNSLSNGFSKYVKERDNCLSNGFQSTLRK